MHKFEKLSIIAIVACLSIGVIGYSFAYFLVGINITGSGASASGSTSDLLKVKYTAGSALTLNNIYPGSGSGTKSFTVSVTPTSKMKSTKYAIKLKITKNGFRKCTSSNKTATNDCTLDAEELVYTLTDSSGTEHKGDLTDGTTMIGEKTLFTHTTPTLSAKTDYNYTLAIDFKDTGADQNHNTGSGVGFTATVEVVFAP